MLELIVIIANFLKDNALFKSAEGIIYNACNIITIHSILSIGLNIGISKYLLIFGAKRNNKQNKPIDINKFVVKTVEQSISLISFF